MKRKTRKPRIGYMAIDDSAMNESFETNGGGGGGSITPIEPTYEMPAEPDQLYPNDPLLETDEPIPNDVAVLLGQEIATEPLPPQMSAYTTPTTTTDPATLPTEQPATAINWKLIIAIIAIGYLLTRKK